MNETVMGSDKNGETLETMVMGIPVKARSRELYLWILVGCLLIGLGWLVRLNLSNWGPPIDLEQKLNVLADGHTEGNYIMAVCLGQPGSVKCKEVSEHLSMPESLSKKLRH